MLTWEDDLEVHALRKRGWSIAAIARHTGHDRKTVRKYLSGDAEPGVRARPSPDPFDPFVDYVTARLVEDPHLWARTLFDELEALGFGLSYQSLTRNIRARELRPTCEACRSATDRPNAVIEHPPGDETQWDWLELPDPPASWGWGKDRAPAGRIASALGQVAGSVVAGGGSAPFHRRAGPGDPWLGRGVTGVAVRPDGHRVRPGLGAGHGELRRGG